MCIIFDVAIFNLDVVYYCLGKFDEVRKSICISESNWAQCTSITLKSRCVRLPQLP